jgi:urease accessory protein
MFASAFPSKPFDSIRAGVPLVGMPAYVRATSEVSARFAASGGVTSLADCFETGGLRLRLPNSVAGCEGVLVNTAGGMTGGDTIRLSCRAGPKAKVRITTQSAEKVYRAEQAPAQITTELAVEKGASLAWIPQETILFDGARVSRSLSANVEATGKLLLLEMTVLGRVARGEALTTGMFRDRWRVVRDGRLVFADDVRLEVDIAATMQSPATGAGATAIATLLYVAPDAERKLTSVRSALAKSTGESGASAWNGILVARFAARDPAHVRHDVARVFEKLTRTAPPRIWAV